MHREEGRCGSRAGWILLGLAGHAAVSRCFHVLFFLAFFFQIRLVCILCQVLRSQVWAEDRDAVPVIYWGQYSEEKGSEQDCLPNLWGPEKK